MRNIPENFVVKIRTHILFSITFSPYIVIVMRQCGKIWYSHTGHRWQYVTL